MPTEPLGSVYFRLRIAALGYLNFHLLQQVAGGYISHYLLERARVVSQSSDERNYHIFYQLCAGAPDKLREQLQLAPPSAFHYLNRYLTL